MAYNHEKPGKKDWGTCMRCGRPIKMIAQGDELHLFSPRIREQRGFQCIVCGRISCFGCSDNRYRCPCGGNAWIARAYMDIAAAGTESLEAGIVRPSAG